MKGIVFDVKEFAVFDGPGIRTTVFMKGCPLRCRWCHNPEGLSPGPQLMVSTSACIGCGACREVCTHPDGCVSCGACVPVCPGGLRRIAGREVTPEELADQVRRSAVFEGGGVTFSGGEPTMQWSFVKETVRLLKGMHIAIETCGYCSDEVFGSVMEETDLIMMDLKHPDPGEHIRWTGCDNAPVLRHLGMLQAGERDYIIRLPLMPGVNDTPELLERSASLIARGHRPLRVELLPFQPASGAKYPMTGVPFDPGFDPSVPPRIDPEPFRAIGLEVLALK